MQYTPNYNLITVEGTDVVNPLVQMNPNFTDIDAAMFANKQASIGSASEIVSGTVHAITRANPDSNYFRYTATGNWTTGDTMSVDGVTVSVYLTDGTTPGTGAYVINSEVFGMISGSRVTLFLSAGQPAITAGSVTYDNTGSGLTAANVQDAIDELNNNITAKTIDLLWSNPDSTIDVSTASATSDVNYDKFEIIYEDIAGSNRPEFSTIGRVGISAKLHHMYLTNAGHLIEHIRYASITHVGNAYTFSFATAIQRDAASLGIAPTDTNPSNILVPLQIIGIKY